MIQRRDIQWHHAWISTRQISNLMEVPTNLKLIIVVRGDFQNKEIIGYTWDPTASIRNLNMFYQISKSKMKEYKKWISLENFYKPMSNIEFLWSWIVYMENTSQNMPTILEDHWGWRNKCMEWLIMESYLLMNSPVDWWINQDSTSPNSKCLYITSMNQIVSS